MTTLSCSKCNGTILRDLDIVASSPVEIVLKFATKCPHCQNMNRVEVRTALVRTIVINGRSLESGVGDPHNEHSPVRTL